MRPLRIVAIYAHPDDMEINCGGTLKIFSDLGHITYGIILTNGELGGDPEIRLEEAKHAAEVLGVKLIHLNLKDGYVTDKPENIDIVTNYIKKIQPDIIFTHYYKDLHQDHRATFRIARIVSKKTSSALLLSEGVSTINFAPRLYVDISRVFKYKIQSLNFHKSQISKINIRYLYLLNRLRGAFIGTHYAEAFYPYYINLSKLFKYGENNENPYHVRY